MTGNELLDYLKSIETNTIKSIEINSNPNASYGSEVDVVINIVTNSRINNYKISLKTNNGYRQKYFNNDNVNLSLNFKKINIYTNYCYAFDQKINTSEIIQNINNTKSVFDFKENENTNTIYY